jgi:hypothetical protein
VNIQIISHNKRGGAQVVLKSVEVLHGKTRSVTLHLDEMWRDKWGQRYTADALIRTAIRYAFIALPEAEPVVEAA